jgi:hypothetical protein
VKKSIALVSLVIGTIAVTNAHADASITGEVGTTGVGAHMSIPLTSNLYARFGANYLGFTHGISTSNLDYDSKFKLSTYDALLDWYPAKNRSFRFTAGLTYNGNKIDISAKSNANGNYALAGHTYSAVDVGKVDGSVQFRKIAPYLGVGWGNAASKEKGWSYSVDVGVLFQGSPSTTLNNSGCTASAAACSQFASDLATEKTALNDEAHKYRAYPVLRIGLNYKF